MCVLYVCMYVYMYVVFVLGSRGSHVEVLDFRRRIEEGFILKEDLYCPAVHLQNA